MKKKMVVLDGYALNPGDLSWEGIERLGDLTVHDRTPSDMILERIGDAEIIFTNKTPLNKEVFQKCKALKYVGVLATGYNIVDTVAAAENGVTVTNVPTYGTDAVAQFATALLLEICHHVWQHNEDVKAGKWAAGKDFCFWNGSHIELSGKTLGIIGFGRIGQKFAQIAAAMGMNILAVANHVDKSLETDSIKYAALEETLKNSDIISLHAPLTDSTRGIINKDAIKKMKDGVIIINTARGPLIDEHDLAAALNSGKVLAAAVDVVSREPIKDDNPLLSAKNCIITPHIAWAALETRQRLMDITVDNLEKFLAGTPVNVISC